MKYKIRKRENITMYEASEVVELDDKHFRKLEENPYTGDSEEEFLKYISNLNLYEGETPDGLKLTAFFTPDDTMFFSGAINAEKGIAIKKNVFI